MKQLNAEEIEEILISIKNEWNEELEKGERSEFDHLDLFHHFIDNHVHQLRRRCFYEISKMAKSICKTS